MVWGFTTACDQVILDSVHIARNIQDRAKAAKEGQTQGQNFKSEGRINNNGLHFWQVKSWFLQEVMCCSGAEVATDLTEARQVRLRSLVVSPHPGQLGLEQTSGESQDDESEEEHGEDEIHCAQLLSHQPSPRLTVHCKKHHYTAWCAGRVPAHTLNYIKPPQKAINKCDGDSLLE